MYTAKLSYNNIYFYKILTKKLCIVTILPFRTIFSFETTKKISTTWNTSEKNKVVIHQIAYDRAQKRRHKQLGTKVTTENKKKT